MRGHFWQFLTNEEGQPIPGASINVYLTSSTVPAWVYLQESGGSPTDTLPQTTTDDDGYFEFWIGNPTELHGYESVQKFAVQWVDAGVLTTGEISDIECYAPPRETYEPFTPPNDGATDTVANKTVSDNDVTNWNNNLVRSITDIIPSSSWTLDASGAHAAPPELFFHTQSSPSATWSVTHNLGIQDVAVYCADNTHHFLTIGDVDFVDENSLIITVSGGTGTAQIIGTDNFKYYYDKVHDLNTQQLMVQLYNTDTNFMIPVSVEAVDVNTIRIWTTKQVNTALIYFK
jgi:hypothetical protein